MMANNVLKLLMLLRVNDCRGMSLKDSCVLSGIPNKYRWENDFEYDFDIKITVYL